MANGTQLQEVDPANLAPARAPKAVLDAAIDAAKALQDVVKQTQKPLIINGEQYLEYEHWMTLGQFYGFYVMTGEAMPVEIDGIRGAKATAKLLTREGLIVGGAEAYCMSDEENWQEKPWFQLASMAQTRAGAKAFRNRLAWVAVLAGYRPTPAEEMPSTQTEKPVLYPFGREKGKPLAEVSDESLTYWTGRIETDLKDKTKSKYWDKSKRELALIRAELERRLEESAVPTHDEFDQMKSLQLDAKLAKDGR